MHEEEIIATELLESLASVDEEIYQLEDIEHIEVLYWTHSADMPAISNDIEDDETEPLGGAIEIYNLNELIVYIAELEANYQKPDDRVAEWGVEDDFQLTDSNHDAADAHLATEQ